MSVRRVESFLLRLVVQDDEAGDPDSWRGRIQHVGTGEERKIDRLEDAVSFISRCLGVAVTIELSPAGIDTSFNPDPPRT